VRTRAVMEEDAGVMVTIRSYHESDAPAVGMLIPDTYGEFNLDFVPAKGRGPFPSPFQYADRRTRDTRRGSPGRSGQR